MFIKGFNCATEKEVLRKNVYGIENRFVFFRVNNSRGSVVRKLLILSGLITLITQQAQAETGIASFYSCCKQTASGERFNPGNAHTVAHKRLPFGTRVSITNLRNGRVLVARVNDRGPFIRGRIVDVTTAGARVLRMDGVAPVRLAVLGR